MKLVNKEEMLLVGLETRTSNQAELSGQGKIPATLQKFYGEQLGKISNQVDNSVLAIDADYASDEQGEYTYFIGTTVSKAQDVPPGLSIRSVPAAKYEVFTSKVGTLPQVVLEVWQQIWQDTELKSRRAFTADFEVYDERCQSPEKAQVDVYIGVSK